VVVGDVGGLIAGEVTDADRDVCLWQTAGADFLRHRQQIDGELVVRRVAHCDSAALESIPVVVIVLRNHWGLCYVTSSARGPSARPGGTYGEGVGEDPLDETRLVLIRADQPHRQYILLDRQIHHATDVPVLPSGVLRMARADLRGGVELLGVRRSGDQTDGASHGPGPVQRALRTAEYLDTLQVKQVWIDGSLAEGGIRGRRQRYVVHVEADRRG